MNGQEQQPADSMARERLKIPLPGMVQEKISTPYTEIPELPPRPKPSENPPELPPRTGVDNGSCTNLFFKEPLLPKSSPHISLIPFARTYANQFPLHVKVTQGHYGSSNFETLSSQEELVVLCEKRREVLRVRSKSGKTYSIPYGSSVPISLLYDPEGNETKAISGITFKSFSDIKHLPPDHLPKVLSCCSPDEKFHNRVLAVKKFDLKNKKMHLQSIPTENEGSSVFETEFDLSSNTQTTFSTKSDTISLYLSDVIKYLHSPCKHSSKPVTALLDLRKFPSTDYSTVMLTDPKLSEPVIMVEQRTEDSLVVVQAKEDGHFENCQFFEIPLEEKFGIELTIFDTQNSMYSSLEPPDYPSVFDLKKLKLWTTDSCDPSQAIQQIFNSSLRLKHEMEGIDIPQQRYAAIANGSTTDPQSETTMPVSVPVPSNSFLPEAPPTLPPKPPPSVKVNYSPQQSSGSSLSTPPSSAGHPGSPQDFTKTREFKEMVDKAVKEAILSTSGVIAERLQSISSVDTDISQESSVPQAVPTLQEKRHNDKLSPDDLFKVLEELADCEGQWFYLAVYLGVPKSRIDQISVTHASDPNSCKRGLIESVSYWLDNSPNASWSAIVKALYMLEKKNKARELAEKYDADIPTDVDSSHNASSLHNNLSPGETEEAKKIKKLIEQKSDGLQDATRNISKHKQRLGRLEDELAGVRARLDFNEEYILVLTYGSQIAALKMSNQREGATSLGGKDMLTYKSRTQNVQAETTRLQQQLLSIDQECRTITSQLQKFQHQKIALSQELATLERQLNQLVMGGHSAEFSEEMELAMDSPEYYNIIFRNGLMEQKMHQKEITQLQEDLQLKEGQLELLKEKLDRTQENLAKVEQRLSSHYSYVEMPVGGYGDDLVQNENLKTSLQADKINYHLQMASVYFLKAEVKSKLEVRENKMRQSKQLSEHIQTKLEQATPPKEEVTSSRPSISSEDGSDVFVPEKKATPTTKKQAAASHLATRKNERLSRFPQSEKTPNKGKKMPEVRRRAATDNKVTSGGARPNSFRPRTGATASQKGIRDTKIS